MQQKYCFKSYMLAFEQFQEDLFCIVIVLKSYLEIDKKIFSNNKQVTYPIFMIFQNSFEYFQRFSSF